MKFSVCLATLNEEENIAACLDTVQDVADEIIVVDGNSTDQTVKIAKRYKAKVTTTPNNPIFHIQKQMAIDQAESTWILQLDADERVTPELKEEIKHILKNGSEFAGFWIKRKKQFLGQWIKKGGHYPDARIRFFKNGKGKLPQKSVHEEIEIDGRVGWLKGELLHLPTPSFTVYITKDNRYSTLLAQELLTKDPGIGAVNFIRFFIFAPLTTFLSMYIRHRGYVDGFPGFVFAFYSALTHASAYVKYWEFKHHPEISERVASDWV